MTPRVKLAELEPQFLRYEERDGHEYHVHVDSIAEATGLFFLCPKCFQINGGPVGNHGVICWNPSVPADRESHARALESRRHRL